MNDNHSPHMQAALNAVAKMGAGADTCPECGRHIPPEIGEYAKLIHLRHCREWQLCRTASDDEEDS